jgi:Trk K+ transport system NAD-binding subunit
VRDPAHGKALESAGIARIINPYTDAADHAAELLAQELTPTRADPRPANT